MHENLSPDMQNWSKLQPTMWSTNRLQQMLLWDRDAGCINQASTIQQCLYVLRFTVDTRLPLWKRLDSQAFAVRPQQTVLILGSSLHRRGRTCRGVGPTWNLDCLQSSHLKNISQIGSFPQVGMKIKNIWNHHPENMCHLQKYHHSGR